MSYFLPQVRVFQEYEEAGSALARPQYSFIFGPHYHLIRYDEATEKALGYIGSYNRTSGLNVAWPNRPTGAEVDTDNAHVYFDSAWLEYFRDRVGSDQEWKAVDGYTNRIRCATLNLATYGTWERSSVFGTRDVQVGDGILLRATACDTEYEFYSRVNRLVHETVDSEIGTPTDDDSNAPSTSQASSETQTAGDTGTVTIGSDASSYSGAADGATVESYYLTVTTGGDFGTAVLAVTSESGTDDMVDSVTPADGVAFDVGSRGLTATFTSGSATPFVEGQIWRIDVNEAWTPASVTLDSSAEYVGANDGTYIITVVEGGTFANSPKVMVSSTGTLDSSGPYTVTALDSYITLPTGVKFKFTGAGVTGLAKNDRYYITVSAETLGAIKTIELQNALPDAFYGICGDSDDTDTPIDLDVSLSIVKDMEVSRTRAGVLPNWVATATQIQVNSGLTATDSDWTDASGNLEYLSVIRGEVYVGYRALLNTYTNAATSLDEVGDVTSTLGPAVADNPLALGVFKALQNAGGTPVYFMATKGDTLADYSEVLSAVYDEKNTYGFVPLTHDSEILAAVAAHCDSASAADRGRWRVAWFGAQTENETAVLYQDSSEDILYGTITDDPNTTGTQYTILRCEEANFITNEVQAGYKVRTNYIVDPATNVATYDEYTIDAVLTEEEVRLVAGPSLPVSVASKFEIWKVNSNQEIADQVKTQAGSYSSKRVRLVFPDYVSSGGVQYDSMYLCAALAGLRSSVLPHQGLTNVEILGFDDVSRTTEWLGGQLLDEMAEAGVWIVTQDRSGMVYTRHQLTTSTVDINRKEDSLVATFDAISARFLDFFVDSRYIGRRNITPGLINTLRADFRSLVLSIQYESETPSLGSMILSAEIVQLERHPTLTDRVIAKMRVDMPEPFNSFDITLIATAS
jgi:hypothetical protein